MLLLRYNWVMSSSFNPFSAISDILKQGQQIQAQVYAQARAREQRLDHNMKLLEPFLTHWRAIENKLSILEKIQINFLDSEVNIKSSTDEINSLRTKFRQFDPTMEQIGSTGDINMMMKLNEMYFTDMLRDLDKVCESLAESLASNQAALEQINQVRSL